MFTITDDWIIDPCEFLKNLKVLIQYKDAILPV